MNIYNFQLDPFQEEACRAVEAGESVIVAAPTGAGKTVIAEYAAERCRRLGKRVVYTAPIKALSNQKFRDFRAAFGSDHVGVVTGDVTLNPHAPILAMTTEIFRNAVFENARQLNGVACVVFDEIHFINDIERGTVWEESIIFAPQDMQIVCLSATIPNLDQFAGWIESARDKPLRVVSEERRPVPLEHAIYMPGYGVGDLSALKRAIQKEREQRRGRSSSKTGRGRRGRADRSKRGGSRQQEDAVDLIDDLRENDRLPALYFCFSRRGCEERARQFQTRDSFLTPDQSREILEAYDELREMFRIEEDARAEEFRNLLERGIAYHHAGMLPTLKEAVERLFTRGLVRLLFATETFAVGINMPARTVIFESLEKYDGVSVRPLKALEYQQMSGRAGRRGIDDKGYVYASVNPRNADYLAVQRALTGDPEPIESQFNLSYSSILNLLEQYGDMIYEVAEMSFSNYQNASKTRVLAERIRKEEKALQSGPPLECRFGHDAAEVIAQYREVHREVGETLRGMENLRRDAKRRYRGRNGKQRREQALKRLRQAESEAKRPYEAVPCHRCAHLQECQKAYSIHKRVWKQTDRLKEEMRRTSLGQRERIKSRLRALETLGYVEGLAALPRGEVAKRIHGYEAQSTQLMMAGFFDRASLDAVNALAVAVCFESKRGVWYRKPNDRGTLRLLRAAAEETDRIREVEKRCGVDILTPPLDIKLTSAVLAWSQGCAFDELADHTSCSEGDIVRAFRAGADLLRQLRRAAKDHPTLPGKLSDAARRLNRDAVDAERQLRAGG